LSWSKGQFEVVTAVELQRGWLEEARRPEYRSLPVTGPLLVALDMPADARESQSIVFAAVFEGRDLQHYPKYYAPYAERARAVLGSALTVGQARRQSPDAARAIDSYLRDSGRREDDVRYFPMRTRFEWIAVLVDAKDGEVVKMLLVPDS
jgi:hypothetical protein